MSEVGTPESVAGYILKGTESKSEEVSSTFDEMRPIWEKQILEAETKLGYKLFSEEHLGSAHPGHGAALLESGAFLNPLLQDVEGGAAGRDNLNRTAGARERLESSLSKEARGPVLTLYKAVYANGFLDRLNNDSNFGNDTAKAVESVFEMVDNGKVGNQAAREITIDLILTAGGGVLKADQVLSSKESTPKE